MASTLKHLRSSTANKRPTGSGLSDGQIAINTASGTPGLFVKDNAGAVVKIGPAHVGTVAPNAVPAGSTGNSKGEMWVDENLTTRGLKYYDGTNFVNLTPSGTSATIGLVQLATNAETQAGTVSTKAVTPSGLQSKVSDSISTTSSTVLASATAVKTAYDLANAALPKGGGTVSGVLEIGSTGTFQFDGSSADANKTILAVANPTANRTITLPNITGTVVTTGDNGTVTSTMIANDTIVNADINASAAIVDTKLATISTAGKVSNSATTATNANTASTIVARDGSGDFSASTITASGILVTGTATAASLIPAGSSVPANGLYLPAANSVAISTNGSHRVRIDSTGNVGIGTTSPDSALQVQGLITGTAVTQTSTDTTAGRLTKVGDFGVGGEAAVLLETSASLDTLQNNGLFAWASSEPAGSPGIFAQMLHVQRSSASRSQLVFRSAGTQQVFIRGYTVGAWQPWYQLYHQNTILGTVSQSSGVPTGAIIQRGSNANGEFVRYADGTMICTNTLTESRSTIGVVQTNWTMPSAFLSGTSYVSQVHPATSRPDIVTGVAPLRSSATVLEVYVDRTNTTNTTIYVQSIGRWY